MLKRFLLIGIIPFIFLLDRLSKVWVIRHFVNGEGVSVWPGVFHLTRVNNTGAAFGLLKDNGFFLTLVSVICVSVLSIYVARAILKNLVSVRPFASALVIAGAIGNLYDRLSYGYVVDFLDFRIWPVFNIADTSICVGVGLVAMTLLKK